MSLKPPEESRDIARQIRIVRGQRVLLDEQLAALYGVSTKALNQAVRRKSRTVSRRLRPAPYGS